MKLASFFCRASVVGEKGRRVKLEEDEATDWVTEEDIVVVA